MYSMERQRSLVEPKSQLFALEKCHLITDSRSLPCDKRDKVLELVEKTQMIIASRSPGKTFKFKLEDFEFGALLGSGRFGTVFLVKDKKIDFLLALKSVKKELIQEADMEAILKREILIHSKLSHKNIVQFFTLFDDSLNWYLLMEYMPGGSLNKFRLSQKEHKLSQSIVAKYTFQLADALSYLHSLKIVHRNVKPENILLDVFGNAKLTDFVWAASCTCIFSQNCPISYYTAPEIMEEKNYDHKVDVWSLGVLIYELLCGKAPFLSKDIKFLLKKIQKSNITFPDDIDKLTVKLLTSLIKYNPMERLEASEVMDHPWINL